MLAPKRHAYIKLSDIIQDMAKIAPTTWLIENFPRKLEEMKIPIYMSCDRLETEFRFETGYERQAWYKSEPTQNFMNRMNFNRLEGAELTIDKFDEQDEVEMEADKFSYDIQPNVNNNEEYHQRLEIPYNLSSLIRSVDWKNDLVNYQFTVCRIDNPEYIWLHNFIETHKLRGALELGTRVIIKLSRIEISSDYLDQVLKFKDDYRQIENVDTYQKTLSSEESQKNQGGRPRKSELDDIWTEILRKIYTKELIPKSQSDIQGELEVYASKTLKVRYGEKYFVPIAQKIWRRVFNEGNY